ncbi:MAG: WS/DGAT/MGAT family O-acyltransferase, partial [Panacagrimonas sp.]
AFLYLERPNTPMHVGGLLVFELPRSKPKGFCRDLVAELRASTTFHRPWNQRLASTRLIRAVHHWTETRFVDLEYHVRHSALPAPGGERELGQLIARLHSHPMDMGRPLWEMHVVEGLEWQRFAVYIKLHHALTDGIGAQRMVTRSLTSHPDDLDHPLFWMLNPSGKPKPNRAGRSGPVDMRDLIRDRVRAVGDVARAFGRISRSAVEDTGLVLPFQAPRSPLNGRVRSQRRFATQQYDIERVRKLARASDASLNDVVLALSSAAIRRFLLESNALPARSLTAGIPVSIRAKDDLGEGNAISMAVSTLATDVKDPVGRLRAITASTRCAKAHLQQMSRRALQPYTTLFALPYVAQMATGIGSRRRPVFNVVISNVPGPTTPLYLRGARLMELYPISLALQGQALNISCVSYAGTLNFGFIAARDSVPHMQKLAVYMGEALEELELALGCRIERESAIRQNGASPFPPPSAGPSRWRPFTTA